MSESESKLVQIDVYAVINENVQLKKKLEDTINELNEVREHLKKYTSPSRSKTYYATHKDEILKKAKEYRTTLSQEKKKEYARTAYLNSKEKKLNESDERLIRKNI